MMWSRQTFLGLGMIVGGGVMLYAMAQQIDSADDPAAALVAETRAAPSAPAPLTTDLATEKRLLAQKQKERAARIAEQEKRAKELQTEQENAEAEALAKSRAENQFYVDKTNAANNVNNAKKDQTPKSLAEKKPTQAELVAQAAENKAKNDAKKAITAKANQDADKKALDKKAAEKKQAERLQAAAKKVQDKKEAQKKEAKAAAAAPKSASTYSIQSGDNLGKLAEKYHVPLSALAQANNLSQDATIKIGQKLTIPSQQQITKLKQAAFAAKKAEDDKKKQEAAKAKKSADIEQRLTDARKTVKETDAKGTFGVQVALATSQANADEVVKKLTKAGYEVKTSKTDRGVRVMVGPERGKVAALALKDKLNNDPNVKTDSAWVLYWR